MSTKTNTPVVLALTCLFALCPSAAFAAKGPPPTIRKMDIQTPFKHVYPGNEVVIRMHATGEAGVSMVNLRLHASPYIGGKNELMSPSVVLEATEKDGELRGSFVAPSFQVGNDGAPTGKPLPKGRYRASLTHHRDGEGAVISHAYIVAGEIYFDPDPVVSVTARLAIDSRPDADGKLEVAVENPTDAAAKVTIDLEVRDHFQKPVASVEKALTVPPGKQVREFPFPARDAKRFRADIRHRVGAGPWESLRQYMDVDFVASGPRRARRIESGPWEKIVPEVAPSTPPACPPEGDWVETTFPLRPDWSETSHWTWFRQEIEPRQWLTGRRIELEFGQADYTCHVYLNGRKIGQHMGSATAFSFDVTGAWLAQGPNTLEVAVGAHATTFADPNADGTYNCLTPGVSSKHAMLGIWERVALVSHAEVFVDDVFVMPSVRDRKLRVRTWLTNSGDGPATVTLRHSVEDAREPVLAIPDQKVEVAAGETRLVEQERPWPNPVLWWPARPRLYRLRTHLANAGSQPVDEVSTRFGFREISLDGMNVRFNGEIYRPLSFSMASGAAARPRPDASYLPWWIDRKRTTIEEAPLLRTHQSPNARWVTEIADEIGVCLVIESQFNSVVVNAMHDPRFWRNAEQHEREMIVRDRNSPSVVMWSMSNEVLHASGASRTPRDENAANLKKLAVFMKQIDPTRPIVEEGGADIDGTWEMLDMHYPRKWFNHVDFPNYCNWLKVGGMSATGAQAPVVRWNGDKPVSIGEEGNYAESHPPHDMATYAGDAVYGEPVGYGTSGLCESVDDMAMAGLIEGARKSGVWRIAADLGGSGGPLSRAAQKRVRLFIDPKNDHLPGGRTLERLITVFHDVLEPHELRLAWKVTGFIPDVEHNFIDERILVEEEQVLEMAPGQVVRETLRCEIPEVQRPSKMLLTVELADRAAGRIEHAESLELWAYPVRPLTLPVGARVGLYDPESGSAAALGDLPVARLEEITAEALAGLDGLLVGERIGDAPEGARQVLADFVGGGGKVIMLMQRGQTGLGWIPVPGLQRGNGIQHTCTFVRAPGHPILAGIDDRLLRLWSEDHVVSRDALAKRPGHNFLPLIDAGAPRGYGLAYAPLAEVATAQGCYVLCQLRLTDAAGSHPAARMILQNLLNYMAAPPFRRVAPAGLLLAAESPHRRLLDDIGASAADLPADGDWKAVGTIIVDPDGATGKGGKLRAFAEAGGTVLVKGLSPQTLEPFAGLFAAPPTLVADTSTTRPVRTQDDAILAGISNEALYWARRRSRFSWRPGDLIGAPVYDFLIRPNPNLVDLYRTEPVAQGNRPAESRGAGLVKIPVGKGLVVVDQVRWEQAFEEQPKGYGGRVTFADGLKRYVSYMLTNLGVEQR